MYRLNPALIKPKPKMCEWNKKLSKWAMNNEAHSPANIVVGKKHIHLCFGCSKTKKFADEPIIRFL